MGEVDPVRRMTMHGSFRFFPANIVQGDPVQVQVNWLDNAAVAAVQKRLVVNTPTLRILELALPDDSLDFHLSFKCASGFAQQGHFCIRRDELGQNACLYWFYSLVRGPGGRISWTWEGCAGAGNAEQLFDHRVPGIQYGTTAGSILDRMLRSLTGARHVLEQHAGRWTLRGP